MTEKPNVDSNLKYQRLETALLHGKPDRTPILLSTDDSFQALAAGWDYYDWYYRPFDEVLDALFAFHKRFPLQDGLSPSFNRAMDPGKLLVNKEGRRIVIDAKKGREWQVPKEMHIWSGPDFKDVTEEKSEKEVTIPSLEKIQEEMKQLTEESVSKPALRTKLVREKIGPDVFYAECAGMPFPSTVWRLGDMERAFMVFAEDRKLFRTALELEAEKVIRRIPFMAKAGANALRFNAYFEGADMIAPSDWHEMCFPYYRRIAAECKKAGVFSMVWFLNDCLPLAKGLADAGIDCLCVEQPRRGYSSDLSEFRKIVGNNITLTGWTGEQETICDDRPAMEKRINEQYDAAGKDGNFIFSTTYLTAETKPETIEYFCKKAAEIQTGS